MYRIVTPCRRSLGFEYSNPERPANPALPIGPLHQELEDEESTRVSDVEYAEILTYISLVTSEVQGLVFGITSNR